LRVNIGQVEKHGAILVYILVQRIWLKDFKSYVR